MRVSELCLGTMTFGEDWGWGASREESRRIFDRFVEAGGNFVDTSINYTNGTAERYVGEFIRSERDRFVVATKYSLTTRRDDPNGGGNHRKNMMRSLDASLRRLGTDYLDLYYLHMWDFTTPVDEVMRAFDDMVRAGKVLYVGFSDTPAWVIAHAATVAQLRGWAPVTGVQLPYNLAGRDPERDLLPMARAMGMAVAAWGTIGGGILTGKYNRPGDEPRRYDGASERTRRIADTVAEVAGDVGATPAQVAIAWVRQQQERAEIVPIIGARTEAQMRENLGVLQVELSLDQLQRLEAASPIDLGFPHTFLVDDEVQDLIFGETRRLLDRREPVAAL
jgi:aryl-alcohol dehydrogenase-like predicted oxidoreductase